MRAVHCTEIAHHMLNTGTTIRKAAEHFGMAKSTLHTEITKRLKNVDTSLYNQVRDLLAANLADRSRRGGYAVQRKYPDSWMPMVEAHKRKIADMRGGV